MDSMLHISLIALPLRALFVPIGFESVRIDPNVLFAEIERAKQEKIDQEIEDFKLKKEFLYFSDKSAENEHMEMDVSKRMEAIVNENEDNDESKADLPIKFIETAFMTVDDSKISLIPVVFDVNNRSIITKGLEVKGMIPFNIPRKIDQKGLLLERYEHIAYNEEQVTTMDAEMQTTMADYISLCNFISRQLVVDKNAKPESKELVLPPEMFARAKRYYQEVEKQEHNPYRMFMMLKELLDMKLEKDDDRERFMIGSCVDESKLNDDGMINTDLLAKFDLSADMVASMPTNERLVRPLMDTVLENHNDRANIRIMEINPSMHLFAPRIVHLIKSSFVGNLNIDYTYANTGSQIISKDMESLKLKSVEWNRSTNAFLNDMNGIDLIIARLSDSSVEGWNMEKQLEAYCDCLKVWLHRLILLFENINDHFCFVFLNRKMDS